VRPANWLIIDVGQVALIRNHAPRGQRGSGLPAQQVRAALREGAQQVVDALAVLHDAPLYIEQEPGSTVMDVRSKARRLAAQVPLRLVIVDYLQLSATDGAGRGVQPGGRGEQD